MVGIIGNTVFGVHAGCWQGTVLARLVEEAGSPPRAADLHLGKRRSRLWCVGTTRTMWPVLG